MAKVVMTNGRCESYNTVLLVELTGSEATEIFGTHQLPVGREIKLCEELQKLRELRKRFLQSPGISKQLRAMAELFDSVTPMMVEIAEGPKEEEGDE